jgi:hypothetical protein
MPTDCEIILRWEATPAELTGVGLALWRWCLDQSAEGGTYPYLNNQTLSDLIAGRFPSIDRFQKQSDTGQPGFHFHVHDEASSDLMATIESMRRAIPRAAIEDIVVAGKSWRTAARASYAQAGTLSADGLAHLDTP